MVVRFTDRDRVGSRSGGRGGRVSEAVLRDFYGTVVHEAEEGDPLRWSSDSIDG